MQTKALQYTVMLLPEPEGGYTITVPALPGCVSFGRTIAEAKAMVMDAISGYVASLRKHGEPVPSDEGGLVTSVALSSDYVSKAS